MSSSLGQPAIHVFTQQLNELYRVAQLDPTIAAALSAIKATDKTSSLLCEIGERAAKRISKQKPIEDLPSKVRRNASQINLNQVSSGTKSLGEYLVAIEQQQADRFYETEIPPARNRTCVILRLAELAVVGRLKASDLTELLNNEMLACYFAIGFIAYGGDLESNYPSFRSLLTTAIEPAYSGRMESYKDPSVQLVQYISNLSWSGAIQLYNNAIYIHRNGENKSLQDQLAMNSMDIENDPKSVEIWTFIRNCINFPPHEILNRVKFLFPSGRPGITLRATDPIDQIQLSLAGYRHISVSAMAVDLVQSTISTPLLTAGVGV